MFGSLDILQTAQGMARHAGARQSLVAENMANADTPGYRARDLESIAASEGIALRRTRESHLGSAATGPARMFETPTPPAPNGNTVSLESEMVRAADIRRQHDLAMTIYRESLDILRASLGRIR